MKIVCLDKDTYAADLNLHHPSFDHEWVEYSQTSPDEILQRLDELVSIGFPLLVGTSRKSFLTLGDPSIEPLERETLTAATTALAIEKGAKLIRVHNPASQTPIVKLMQAARLTVPSADQDD